VEDGASSLPSGGGTQNRFRCGQVADATQRESGSASLYRREIGRGEQRRDEHPVCVHQRQRTGQIARRRPPALAHRGAVTGSGPTRRASKIDHGVWDAERVERSATQWRRWLVRRRRRRSRPWTGSRTDYVLEVWTFGDARESGRCPGVRMRRMSTGRLHTDRPGGAGRRLT